MLVSRLGKMERALYILAGLLFLVSAVMIVADYLGTQGSRSALNLIYAGGILVMGFIFFKLGSRREKKDKSSR